MSQRHVPLSLLVISSSCNTNFAEILFLQLVELGGWDVSQRQRFKEKYERNNATSQKVAEFSCFTLLFCTGHIQKCTCTAIALIKPFVSQHFRYFCMVFAREIWPSQLFRDFYPDYFSTIVGKKSRKMNLSRMFRDFFPAKTS